jgi:hypothetical protein
VERVESARRLVEDEESRRRGKSEEERELLLVAVRVLAVLAAEVEIEPLRDASTSPSSTSPRRPARYATISVPRHPPKFGSSPGTYPTRCFTATAS